jgi:pilus assembly protein FimV
MDPIMIGIAAVVILVIVAGVFLMKKGKSQTTVDTQTQVKRPKTLAEQQRELELQRQSQQPSPYAAPNLPQSTLQAAQTLSLNAQAHNLKTLVDEDQSINARSTAMTHTAEAVEPDGLDFDLPGFKQDSDKPAINSTLHVVRPTVTQVAQPANPVDGISSKADNELDFDFALDVPETKIAPVVPVPPATKPTTETTAAQSQSNELTFDDFDFDLSSKEPATAETVAAPVLESTTKIFAPIDEPVTTTSASNVNNNNNAISDSDFDFDFSLPETQSTPTATAPALTTPTAAPSADNNVADDFDFDFELNAEPAVTPTNDATTEADLSFDASDTKVSSNLTSDAVTSVPVASDEATDIASFALDDELLRQAEAASLAKPATPSVAEPVVDLAEVNAPKPSDSLLISDDMFDLSFDDSTTQAATPANTQTTTTPTASPETTSIADKASLKTAPVVEDLSAILDVIKDIDTDTLNVDLAEQYVNLGEYDSAKRLLDEIKDSNNTALVERATALRQRIA